MEPVAVPGADRDVVIGRILINQWALSTTVPGFPHESTLVGSQGTRGTFQPTPDTRSVSVRTPSSCVATNSGKNDPGIN
ncbi:hypothetical protein N7510_007284 [Penicillium lagena]|uniref:uncharacterized protein n=1 Tax=Penicillium lagena TaxID=94218 RepID=UPI00254056B9|nr:uncharacterized protein N7510_007284 [Penicillium lagena]KAJ5610565.1 hypothetical protein N7510_007284 [Penicillium lagena]